MSIFIHGSIFTFFLFSDTDINQNHQCFSLMSSDARYLDNEVLCDPNLSVLILERLIFIAPLPVNAASTNNERLR